MTDIEKMAAEVVAGRVIEALETLAAVGMKRDIIIAGTEQALKVFRAADDSIGSIKH